MALLGVETVIVTATTTMVDGTSGHLTEKPILSAAIPAESLARLNLTLVDPSDAMKNFVHNMKFMKTKGLHPVEALDPEQFKGS